MASDVVTLVDSNVLLDIVTDDPTWSAWSSNALAEAFDHGRVVVNPIVAVDDIEVEHTRLTSKGVVTQPPTDIGTAVVAVFDDTCGNLTQLIEEKPDENHADAR